MYLGDIVTVCLPIKVVPYSHLYAEGVDVKLLIFLILAVGQATSIIIYDNILTVLINSMGSVRTSW
jgi:hypothetical protein